MRITLKILLIFTLILLVFIPSVKAFGINMNLVPNTIENNEINNTTSNNTSNENTNTFSNTSRSVTVTSSDDDEFLTVENVLSIILIVIGILLILLGIAIIIRFK